MRMGRRVLLCELLVCSLFGVSPAAWGSECATPVGQDRTLHTDSETGREIRTAPLTFHLERPDRTLLYGDHLLAIGRICSMGFGEHQLTLYEPDGRVRWSLGTDQLLSDPYDYRSGGSWYVSVRRNGNDIDAGASIVFVLSNYDELQVRLRDGAVALRRISVAELGNDATKLKARARYLFRRDDLAGQQALLRQVLAQNPADYEAVSQLAGSLRRRDASAAAALWRDLEARMPLPALQTPVPTLTYLRYWQAYYLKEAESYQEALELIANLLQTGASEERLWALQAELLLALGRGADAKASFDRQIALIAAGLLGPSPGSWSHYYNTVDYDAGLLERAGYAALASTLRRQPEAQPQIIEEFRARALQYQERWYTDELGRIFVGAAARGDYRDAIEWYTESARRLRNRFGDIRFGDTHAEEALCHLHRHAAKPPNFAEALRYCDQAAERGSPPGRFWAGLLRLAGLGTQRDEATALRLIEAAAERGDGHLRSFDALMPEQRRAMFMADDLRWAADLLRPYAQRGNATLKKMLQQLEANQAHLR